MMTLKPKKMFKAFKTKIQKGFTLIEMMIGLVVFMIGIVGLSGLILIQSQGNRISRGLDDASTLLQSKVESMSSITYSVLGTDVSSPSNNGLTSGTILSEGPLNRLNQTSGTGSGPYDYYRYMTICKSDTTSVAASGSPVYCGNVTSNRPPELACNTITPSLSTSGREKMIRVLVCWTDRNGKCHYKSTDSLQFN